MAGFELRGSYFQLARPMELEALLIQTIGAETGTIQAINELPLSRGKLLTSLRSESNVRGSFYILPLEMESCPYKEEYEGRILPKMTRNSLR